MSAPDESLPQSLATVGTTTQALDLRSIGDILVKSKFFADARDASQAIVKVLMGRELGFGPMASMTGINVIQGKPALGANLIAAKIQQSGQFRYRVERLDNKGCVLSVYERAEGAGPPWQWDKLGESSFTSDDAIVAQLAMKANYRTSPRNMFFARAISNAAKWYCSGLFGGNPVYVPEELGAQVDGEGRMLSLGAELAGPARRELEQIISSAPTGGSSSAGDGVAAAFRPGAPLPEHYARDPRAAAVVTTPAGRTIDTATGEILREPGDNTALPVSRMDGPDSDPMSDPKIADIVFALNDLGPWRTRKGITRAIFGEWVENETHLAIMAEQSPEVWKAGLERLGLATDEE